MRQILIFAYLRVYFSEVYKYVKSLRRNLIVDGADGEGLSDIFSNDTGTFVHLVNSIDIACCYKHFIPSYESTLSSR